MRTLLRVCLLLIGGATAVAGAARSVQNPPPESGDGRGGDDYQGYEHHRGSLEDLDGCAVGDPRYALHQRGDLGNGALPMVGRRMRAEAARPRSRPLPPGRPSPARAGCDAPIGRQISPRVWRTEAPIRAGSAPLHSQGPSNRRGCHFSSGSGSAARPRSRALGEALPLLLGEVERKLELLDRQRWSTRWELASAVFEWIEAWYNPRRRHTSIDDLSPVEYERLHAAAVDAASAAIPFPNLRPSAPHLPNDDVAA